MSNYLARLREIEIEKISDSSHVNELPKLTEVSFGSFDSAIQAENEKNILLIQSWLFQIGEPEADHFIVLDKCRNDPEAMKYFMRHANGEFNHV